MFRVILFVLFCVGLGTVARSEPAEEIVGKAYARDGDDLVINGTRIRLHGIDAFELDQTCSHSGGSWACGVEAKRALDALVAGKEVRCELAQQSQTHGRSVMRCYVAELEINAEVVKLGFALDCPRFSHGSYEAIEREAQAAARGAWASTFVTPWAHKGKTYCETRSAGR
jgi:endonuclease YncB( thermonuclease family)